jgi:TIR domain-containing protein
MTTARRSVQGLVSYAHEDWPLVERFRRLLDKRLEIDRQLDFSLWADIDLLIGEPWDDRIQTAMATADFALLLLSPAFLSRPYITSVEIPTVLNNPRILVMPVGLQHVDLARSDLRGLDPHQIFLYRHPRSGRPRWFADLAGQNPARFCDELARQVAARCLGRCAVP